MNDGQVQKKTEDDSRFKKEQVESKANLRFLFGDHAMLLIGKPLLLHHNTYNTFKVQKIRVAPK